MLGVPGDISSPGTPLPSPSPLPSPNPGPPGPCAAAPRRAGLWAGRARPRCAFKPRLLPAAPPGSALRRSATPPLPPGMGTGTGTGRGSIQLQDFAAGWVGGRCRGGRDWGARGGFGGGRVFFFYGGGCT